MGGKCSTGIHTLTLTQTLVIRMKVVDLLEFVTLGDITTSTQIYYDPDPRSTVVADDLELIEGHFDIQEEVDDKETDR